MPVHVYWEDEEKTILRHVYEGDVDLNVYIEVADQNLVLQSEVTHPVDVIVDVRAGNIIMNKRIMDVIRVSIEKTPSTQRLTVNVGVNSIVQNVASMMKPLLPEAIKNVYWVKTIEDAHKIIEDYRSKLRKSAENG